MRSALRKRPFRPACAAATSASAPQFPESDRILLAPASCRSRLLLGSGR